MSEMESFWGELLSDVSPPSRLDISDVPVYEPQRDIFAEKKRKQWTKTGEQRCDFSRHLTIAKRCSYLVIAPWKRTVYGRTLREIKADDTMVQRFAETMTQLITDVLGKDLDRGGWALITTPKRRHRERNFATRVCLLMAEVLRIPFYEDVASACNTDRVHPVFRLNLVPEENNLIVFDDIVTTGITIETTKQLLIPYHKNMVFFVGINNHL